jgi:L-asparaginase
VKEIANVRVVEFSNIPSDYMGPDRWPGLTKKVEEVLADASVVRCVITHGTDTLDQTPTFST